MATNSAANEPDGSESKRSSLVDRRRFLATSMASVAALSGCTGSGGGGGPTDNQGTTAGSKQEKPYEGETLTAAVWSGSDYWMDGFRKHIIPPFEEKTGATVELVTVWSEILAKIKAAPEDDPPFDVTVGDGYVHKNGVAADLFQKIRYDNIPNFADVYPYLKEFRSHEHGVPVSGMPMSILYRTDSDFKPETWSDFGSQAGVAANIGMEGSWYAYPAHIVAITMDDEPKAGEMYDDKYHKAVFDELNEWNIDSWFSGGAEFWELLRNGVVDAAQYYMNTHRDAKNDDSIGFQYPTEGSVWYWDHYHVVRGTQHRRLAEEWINHLLEPKIQSISAQKQYNAAANEKAEYTRDILKENYPQSNEEWKEKAVFFDAKYLSSHWSTFSKYFKQVKTGSWSG